MTYTRKAPPKTAFGRKFSSHPDIVRQQVAEARQGGSGITIQQARAIAEELKANRRIWFAPPLTAAQIANEVAKLHSERWREKNGVRSNNVSRRTKARVKHERNE